MVEKPKDLLCLEGISCLAFNKDLTSIKEYINYLVCILSKKDKDLYIYETENFKDVNSWNLKYILKSVNTNIFNLNNLAFTICILC
jgi:hypothetical protein